MTERSKAHAKHSFSCTCGAIVHGNGAKSSHRAMHDRRADGHRYVGYEEYRRRFPAYIGMGSQRVIEGPAPRECPNCRRVACEGGVYCCDTCAVNPGKHSETCPKDGRPATR